MAFLVYFTFMLLISVPVQLSLSMVTYEVSHLNKMSVSHPLRIWERTIYYFIAGYPLILLVGMYIIDSFQLVSIKVNQPVQMQYVLWFCIAHFLLSVLGISVSKYLRKKHKTHIVFTIVNIIAGGCYLYTCLWAITELA